MLLPASLKVQGVVLTDQIKSLDWRIRRAERVDKAPAALLDEAVAKIRALAEPEGSSQGVRPDKARPKDRWRSSQFARLHRSSKQHRSPAASDESSSRGPGATPTVGCSATR